MYAMLDKFGGAVLDLYRGCRELPVNAFQDWAFECVKTVLPFDSALWMTGTLDMKSGDAVFHTFHLHKQPPQLLADWAKIEDRAVFSRKVFSSPGTTYNCVTHREMGPALAAHSRRYGIEHILATTSIDPIASLHELISLYRADPERPFDEAERQFQQQLVPHLAETWRVNRMLHLTHPIPNDAVRSFSAAADGQGILHLVEPGFSRQIREEWPHWRGPSLPDELVAAIGQGNRFVGKILTIGVTHLHGMFLLRCRKKARVDMLTQREREVAGHFSAGRTYKEIARLLALSPATVRNYLNTIYAKLGVGNKVELATLLKSHD